MTLSFFHSLAFYFLHFILGGKSKNNWGLLRQILSVVSNLLWFSKVVQPGRNPHLFIKNSDFILIEAKTHSTLTQLEALSTKLAFKLIFGGHFIPAFGIIGMLVGQSVGLVIEFEFNHFGSPLLNLY